MKALFQARRPRTSHRRRTHRTGLAAVCVAAERLEPRQMLAADGLRPLLAPASMLVMDASMGPNPVVMSKSQVVGTDVKSFVISHVPEGSVVEKWDAAKDQWIDVSTMPTSSNPQELMRLLSNRLIQEGDTIQWRPKAGVGAAAQLAFEMIGWDDGSEMPGASDETLSAVQNLAVVPTDVGELTLTWDPPASGDATNYSITMTTNVTTGSSRAVYVTSNTTYTFTGLSPANGYSFSVTATSSEGTSAALQENYWHAPIGVDLYPRALTTAMDGSIWVANEIDDTVQQIVNDNGGWTAQAPIPVGYTPVSLTAGLDGSIWVASYDADTVQQIVNDDGVWTPQPPIEFNYFPRGLTTGLDGSIWVTRATYATAHQIVNDNGVWTKQESIGVGHRPVALTTGLDGSIWVANSDSDTVQQIANDNGVWTAHAGIGVGATPYALTTGLDGSIWVTNYADNTVQQIVNDNDVWTAEAAIGVGGYPTALTTGFDGSIWVANYGSNTVQQIVYGNGIWTPQAPIDFENARALTTGLDGSIWAASANTNTVQQIAVPPGAPVALEAVLGPAPGQMTLGWQPPVSERDSPVTSYTATVAQGEYFQAITTTDLSCVFDGLTLAGDTTYFTVTASSFSGVSSSATHHVDAYGNTIPQQRHIGVGITTDGALALNGGLDGAGNTYSWTALGDSASGGTRSGSTLGSGGLAFDIGLANQPEVAWAAGQTIEVEGSGSVLTLAGAAVNGPQVDEQIILNFTDGSTATWKQSFSDWCALHGYPNESILSTQSYRNTASGGTDNTTNYIYSYGYTLPEGKTLESVRLPYNTKVRILGAALSEPTAIDLSWNAYGLVVANNQVPNSQGFDGHGNYYNANYKGVGLGLQTGSNSDFDFMQITWGGGSFNLGPAPNHYSQSNNRNGNNNFVQAEGQTISLPSGSFSTLLLIGAAANGNQTDQAIYLDFTDGSIIRWTQSFSDWADGDGGSILGESGPVNLPPSATTLAAANESVVSRTTWVDQMGNHHPKESRFVYGYTFDIPAGKTLKSITLPNNRNVGILGMALV
jgi:virginiamycin B lyase